MGKDGVLTERIRFHPIFLSKEEEGVIVKESDFIFIEIHIQEHTMACEKEQIQMKNIIIPITKITTIIF